ncbi:hypothetical protein Moror_4005 [Moniliophthora roreri MCA 2997]|uniref:Uncharacterized protein n=2 Tax=Moniliophthora roreri TaxID=221103 RepID=V2XND0_MONRO|nr:hypothetical protein Moror_4005 [Moniliophthora roreri MCA 2997]
MSSPDVHPPRVSSPDLQPPHIGPPGPPQSRADLPDPLDVNTFPTSSIDDIAILEMSGLTPEAIRRLQNPPTEHVNVEPKAQELSVQLYLSHSQTLEAKYKESIEVVIGNFPPQSKDEEPLSYYRVKKLVRDITGIDPIENDMCPKACIGYVAQFDVLNTCPFCGLPWIDPALRRHPNTVKEMRYFHNRMKELLEALELNGEIDDICCGEDVSNVAKEKIRLHDTLLSL